MDRHQHRDAKIDAILIGISIVILSASVWIWIAAMPIAREIVFLATTIALVISLVLVVNVAVLVVLRLQRRVSRLEDVLAGNEDQAPVSEIEKVLVVTLSNTERRVINSLEENGGEMTQDELRRVSGLSKSTLSVTLSSLERKSLIGREVQGRTKTVVLVRSIPR